MIDLFVAKYIYEANLFCRYEDQLKRKNLQGQSSSSTSAGTNSAAASSEVDSWKQKEKEALTFSIF